MNKRLKITIWILAVVFGGIVGFNLFKAFMIKRFFASFTPPAVTVSSVKAEKINWIPQIDGVGNFVALNGVEVNSETSGNVKAIHFDSGQYIQTDQPLIDIDDSIDQANLQFYKAELVLKQLNYKRQTDLFKRGATPSSSVDEAKAELDKAQANVQKTQAQIDQKHITSPFTGRLGIRQVNLGQYITPGQTNIVTLQSMDPLYLQFYVPEQLYKRLRVNQNVMVKVEEFPNAVFQGKITAINAKADTNTHNILIQATLPNCAVKAIKDPEHSPLIKEVKKLNDGKFLVQCDTELNAKNKIEQFTFLPGMFAAISVDQPAIPDTIVLPSTAISYSLYGDSVFVIEADDKGMKDDKGNPILRAKRVFVQTGEQRGNYTVIQKGIKAGQTVVGSGELKLQNNTPVLIDNSIQLDKQADLNQIGQ